MKLHTPLIVLLMTMMATLSLLSMPAYGDEGGTISHFSDEELILGGQSMNSTHLYPPGLLDLDDRAKITYVFCAITVPIISISVAFKYLILGKLMKSREDTLQNRYRSDIYRFIQDNPGVNKTQISTKLNINMGTLRYHIDSLKTKKFITEMTDGKYTRFFGCRSCIERGEKRIISSLRNENKRRIVEQIMESPGLNISTISSRTGIGYSTTSECLKQMFDDNMVTRKKDSLHYGYYLNPDMVDIVIKALGY